MTSLDMPGIDRNDPGYQRHCIGYRCSAAFNALDGAPGWHYARRVLAGALCPVHGAPIVSGKHAPSWIRGEDGKATGCQCACGWSWSPAAPATLGEYQGQFMEHVDRATREQATDA